MRRIFIGFILLTSIITLAACDSTSSNQHSTTRHSRSTFNQPHDETKMITLNCDEKATQIDLSFEAQADQGTMAWKLIDPEGNTVWEGSLANGEAEKSVRDFAPIAGDWQLELTMNEAAGFYDIQWTATD
ncbi:MAG: hypothetical protein JXA10_01280 [Anaerolineae bacterium]|nr:hypothetical protein [Anaerolineae bacterium]